MTYIVKPTATLGSIAIAVVLGGCGSTPDPAFVSAQQRLSAASSDRDLRTYAATPLADAQQTLALAEESSGESTQRHYIYMTERKLDLAEAILARKLAEEDLQTLQRTQLTESRRAAPRRDRVENVRVRPLPPVDEPRTAQRSPEPAIEPAANPGDDREKERVLAAIQQERLETALREAREARVHSDRIKDLMDEFKSRQAAQGIVFTIPDIHFAANASKLTPGSIRRLTPLVARLRENPDLGVVVEGYSDNVGTPKSNLDVSLARAVAVKTHLVNQGIDPDRVKTLAFGDRYPIASNDTEEGRGKNRRIEIVLHRAVAKDVPQSGEEPTATR